MANQHLVKALVGRDDAPGLRRELIDGLDIPADNIEIAEPEPATYRDESPDLRVHQLTKVGSRWAIVGVLAGAAVALLLVLVIPPLREWLPYSLILVFGGAWGGGVVVTARGMQVHKRGDHLGEQVHDVSPQDAPNLRILTVVVDRDRDHVVDLLSERGATLLDTWHPKVGRGPDARPASPGQDAPGGPPPDVR